jgi:hypothetical protein
VDRRPDAVPAPAAGSGGAARLMATDRRAAGRSKPPKPLTAHQQALTDEGNRAARRRQSWEGRSFGHDRMAEAPEMLGTKMTTGQIYAARNWGEQTQEETGHPRAYDRQLPGMEDPDALTTPSKWEDLPAAKQADIQRRVKAKSGATIDSMAKAFGSQLDQSYVRAERRGLVDEQDRVRPAGQDFYTSGEPKEVIRQTAKDTGVSQQLVAAVHGDNSPQTPFKQVSRESGDVFYPQDVMARSVIGQIQEGEYAHKVRRPPGAMGYTKNFEKSARRVHDSLYGGKSVGEAAKSSPKTSAYTNSWISSTPDFFTSDVHSGGAMVPHLSSDKPAIINPDGTPKMKSATRGSGTVDVPDREKSQREQAIEVTGFHSMADAAARQAMAARGLGSVRQAQAAQWNEERVQRFGEHRSYDDDQPRRSGPTNLPGQGHLF